MLTPLEIQKIEFTKRLGGYRKSDVDEMFLVIAADYESLYKENIRLKDRMEVLEDLVNKYKGMEDTMRETLVVAQKAADDLAKGANEKAEAVIERANNEAAIIKEGARAKAREISQLRDNAEEELYTYATRINTILDAQKDIVAQILNSRSDKNGLQSNTKSSKN